MKTDKTSKDTTKEQIKDTEIKDVEQDDIIDEYELEKYRLRQLVNNGPAYIPESLKEPGFYHHLFVYDPNNTSQFDRARDLGYEIVHKPGAKIGDDNLANAEGIGTAVTKGLKGGRKYVLMRIPQRKREIIQKLKDEATDEQERDQVEKTTNNTSNPTFTKTKVDLQNN